MKSPMITKTAWTPEEEKAGYSDLQVLHSPAGWYIGTMYRDPRGWEEPGSRDSDYFETREAAEAYLAVVEATGNTSDLRKHP